MKFSIEKILSCPRLPSLPQVALQVIELCRREDTNFEQISDAISNDPALSMKILKTVNSSYYGLSQPVSTISRALVILGLNSVKTLALSFSLMDNLRDAAGESFDMSNIWRRSLYSAIGAKTIAQRVGMVEHEEAFLCGLLQDLGVIAMVQAIGKKYIELIKKIDTDHASLLAAEHEQFGIDHEKVGAALAEKWKLPDILIEPIRWHEHPDKAATEYSKMVYAVALGAKAADLLFKEKSGDAVDDYFDTARKWFNLDNATAIDMLQAIGEDTKEMAKMFDIDTQDTNNTNDILAEANDAMVELSLQTQQNASHLEQQNKKLQKKATTDPLTGAANRGAFTEFFGQQFELSKRQPQPLGLILLDADKFKEVNDTYGHQAGDRVLIHLAKVMMDICPDSGMVARYGGEEFMVVLPNTDRSNTAQIAESIRKAMQDGSIEIDDEGNTLTVTISLGVACFDGVRTFRRLEQLINAADQAVYAAKKSGRNCVRVFTPREKNVPTTA